MTTHTDNRNIGVLQFLDAYEKQESLWNPCLESYKNKSARDEAYTQIIRDVNVPTMTINDVKLKVKSIRTTYTKELRLLTKHRCEGKPYTPKLFWFNRANIFLKNVSLSRDKRTSINGKTKVFSDEYKPCVINYISDTPIRQVHDDADCDYSETEPGTATSSNYEFKTIPSTETHIPSSIETIDETEETTKHTLSSVDILQQVPTSFQNARSTTNISNAASNTYVIDRTPDTYDNAGQDEFELFCRSVAAQLRSISDLYSRSVAKLKIQQILFEAETGHYRNNPCITIPVSQHTSNS